MKNSVKILSVIFAFILLASSIPFSASARSIAEIEADIAAQEKELEKLAGQKENKEEYIASLEKQNKNLSDQIAAIEEKIAPIQAEINKLDKEITELETQIDSLEKEITSIDAEIAEQKVSIDETYELLAKRLKAVYMAGETSELEIFLSATDFQDFLNRTELIRQVSKHDTDMVKELEEHIKKLNSLVEDLSAKRNKLDESRTNLETDKASVEKNKAVYTAEKAKLESAVAKNEANIRKQNAIIGELNEDSAYVKNLIKQIEKEKAAAAAELDKELGNNGSSGNGTVEGSSGHNFRISSKGTICPIQESGVQYSTRYAEHVQVSIGAVDLVSYQNRYINGKYYWTTKTAKIYAMADGVVVKSTYSSSYGNHVSIDHGNGLNTLYAHMDTVNVSVGDTVKQGQVIGTVGNTGKCIPLPTPQNPVAGSHLHLEVRVNGNRVNPELYLPSPMV